MDKNTIYGLLLMAAVFFAFMWLQPKNETTAANDGNSTEVPAAQAAATGTDSLTITEREWLASNIAENGSAQILEDNTRVTSINENGLHLTLRGDSIYGTVEVGGRQISYADIEAADLTKMTAAEQRNAISMLRSTSASMGRYGKFARFLSGSDSTVNLENDVLSLRISSKSGSITRAELKKYDT